MQLHVLEQGYIEAMDAAFITDEGRHELVWATWPVRCYLFEHPHGWLLWDTGLSEATLGADPGALGGNKRVASPLVPWLSGFGLAPEDITHLGFSHLHLDHAGNANLFDGAIVLLNGREHAYAFSGDPDDLYIPDDYAALRDSRMMLIGNTCDIFGDGTAVIHAAPGHTVGHQVLVLTLPGQQPVILAGDACYAEADRFHRRAPVWNAGLIDTFRSLDRIEQLAADLGARVMVHHAPGI